MRPQEPPCARGELPPLSRPNRCRGVLAEPRRRKRVERAEGQRGRREREREGLRVRGGRGDPSGGSTQNFLQLRETASRVEAGLFQ
eukprot:568324-Heterocapsa_arctica.AAC.1